MKFISLVIKCGIYTCLFITVLIVTQSHAYCQPSAGEKIGVDEKTFEADSLFALGKKFQDSGNFKEAIPQFQSSLTIYRILKDNKKIGQCLSNIGIANYYQGNFSDALRLYKETIVFYEKADYKKGVSSVFNNIGGIHYYLGNNPKALENYKKAVKIQEEIGDKNLAGALSTNIGNIYAKMKDSDNAMRYHRKAYSIYKELGDKIGVAQSVYAIGGVYTERGEYGKSFDNYKQALTIIDKEKDDQLRIAVLASLGKLFYNQQEFEEALSYYKQCLQYATKLENLQFISESQIEIGNIYHKLNRNRESVIKCKAGLKIAKQMKAITVEKDACECLYNSYKALNNTSLALSYYETANALNDSLKSEETSNKLMAMEVEKQQEVDSVAYLQKANIIKQEHEADIREREKTRNIIIISLVLALLVAGVSLGVLNLVRKSRAALRVEKDRSEALLLNILPEEIAEELKEKGSVSAKNYELVSILFSDFIGFTQISEQMSPESLVEEINECFKAFDLISEKYKVEKIKTIGDAYMAAGGMPILDESSYKNVVLAGLEMQQFMLQRASDRTQLQLPSFNMRLGIHVGPIVAGIVGIKKFQYDVWGDTVNTASRIESNGMVGKVNISESLYLLIKDEPCFTFENRGSINAKGKGDMNMYFVEKAGYVPA